MKEKENRRRRKRGKGDGTPKINRFESTFWNIKSSNQPWEEGSGRSKHKEWKRRVISKPKHLREQEIQQ